MDESDSYGVEMALQLVDKAGGGEVTLVSMAPNNEVSGLRTALAMGAAKAILVSDPALLGSDALSTAKVLAAQSATLRWSSPPPNRLRLHRYVARATRRAVGSAVGDLREGHHDRRRRGQCSPPDRSGLRRGALSVARARLGDGRCRRAALSLVQRHHGGQEQTARATHARGSGNRCRQRRLGRAGQEITEIAPVRHVPPVRSSRRRNRAQKIGRVLESLKVLDGFGKGWSTAKARVVNRGRCADASQRSRSRCWRSAVRSPTTSSDLAATPMASRQALGAHGAKSLATATSTGLPGPSVASALVRHRVRGAPICSCSAQPMTSRRCRSLSASSIRRSSPQSSISTSTGPLCRCRAGVRRHDQRQDEVRRRQAGIVIGAAQVVRSVGVRRRRGHGQGADDSPMSAHRRGAHQRRSVEESSGQKSTKPR